MRQREIKLNLLDECDWIAFLRISIVFMLIQCVNWTGGWQKQGKRSINFISLTDGYICIHSGMTATIAYVSLRGVLIILANMIWSLTYSRVRDVLTPVISIHILSQTTPDSKVQGAKMGPAWVLWAPGGLHVGPMNLAIRNLFYYAYIQKYLKYLLVCGFGIVEGVF